MNKSAKYLVIVLSALVFAGCNSPEPVNEKPTSIEEALESMDNLLDGIPLEEPNESLPLLKWSDSADLYYAQMKGVSKTLVQELSLSCSNDVARSSVLDILRVQVRDGEFNKWFYPDIKEKIEAQLRLADNPTAIYDSTLLEWKELDQNITRMEANLERYWAWSDSMNRAEDNE